MTATRVLLGALLGGIAIYIAGSITHLVLPIADNEVKAIPNEFAVIAALKSSIPTPGVYIYPGMEGVNQKDQAAMTSYQERIKDLPHGLVILNAGPGLVTPQKLTIQFLGDLLAASVGAALLAMAPLGSYLRRLILITLLGLFAGFLIDFPLWNWYGFSGTYVSSDMLDQVLRSLAGAAVLAAVVKPSK